jgi:hypothetical protein
LGTSSSVSRFGGSTKILGPRLTHILVT